MRLSVRSMLIGEALPRLFEIFFGECFHPLCKHGIGIVLELESRLFAEYSGNYGEGEQYQIKNYCEQNVWNDEAQQVGKFHPPCVNQA